jgi:hypothetical protein
MNRKSFVLFLSVLLLTLSAFSTAAAQDTSEIKVLESESYKITIGNYEAEILIPEMSGLADSAEMTEINQSFSDHGAELMANFVSEAKAIRKEYPVDGPHYAMQYKFEVLYDNAERLVFRKFEFSAAGSSNYSAQYFTIDKAGKKLVTLADHYSQHPDYMTAIRQEIESSMRAYNQSNEMKYWIDEAPGATDPKVSLDQVFSKIEENRQYYLNQDGDVVITFNKYDVAPGAMGTPEFVIPADLFK